jgi:hypothetical protein
VSEGSEREFWSERSSIAASFPMSRPVRTARHASRAIDLDQIRRKDKMRLLTSQSPSTGSV